VHEEPVARFRTMKWARLCQSVGPTSHRPSGERDGASANETSGEGAGPGPRVRRAAEDDDDEPPFHRTTRGAPSVRTIPNAANHTTTAHRATALAISHLLRIFVAGGARRVKEE